MPPPNSKYALPVRTTTAKRSPAIDRKDITAALKSTFNVDMTPKTMKTKKEAVAVAGTSKSIPLSRSRSLSTVGTVKTEYFGGDEEIERRDANETRPVGVKMESKHEELLRLAGFPRAQISMTILTQKADSNNNWPTISRSASTNASSLWQSIMHTDSMFSANSILFATSTTSTSEEIFSSGCPVGLDLSYSDQQSMQGLEVVPRDTMLSAATSFVHNESIEDAAALVDSDLFIYDHGGCLIAVKELTDDFTSAARDANNFYNSPRKSVTFTKYAYE